MTILDLRKPLTIPGALKVLFLSLAVSDLSVGLLVQPLYITSLVMLIKENTQGVFLSVNPKQILDLRTDFSFLSANPNPDF